MIIIKLRDGVDWYKQNWIYRQVIKDVGRKFPNEPRVNQVLEEATWYSTLDLLKLDESTRFRTLEVLKIVIEETCTGKIKGWIEENQNDTENQMLYIGALKELLDLIMQGGGLERREG